ncbi:uncharacterized protein [Littorina saxatilis]|uniref:Uncharacterized protein n=1 Tax=Littorina saxatilis TaxID=31220 RepID=A0AAN9B2H9_9CAEN
MTVSGPSRPHSGEEGENTGLHRLSSSGGDRSPSPLTPCTIQPQDVSSDVKKAAQDEDPGQSVQTPLLETGDVHLKPDPEVTQAPEEEEEEDDGVPHDRGWAWVVVFGMFTNFVLLSGYLKSSGLFFVELLRKFNAPATHTALLFSIRAGIFSLCGLYVMNVFLPRFGPRRLVLMGGLLMSLSAILSSVANELTLLICIHSVLLALGMAMLISPGEVLIGAYFKQRRSLALSLAKCGASIGNMAVPPLVSFLLQEYGLSGTLLLYGGICLNSIPAALLLRPTSFFSKSHVRRRQQQRSNANNAALGIGSTGDVTSVVCRSDSEDVRHVGSNGVGRDTSVGPRTNPSIVVESCDQTGNGSGRTSEVSSGQVGDRVRTVSPRKAKSEFKPSAVYAARGSDMLHCSSDSRVKPHARGAKPHNPLQPESMSEIMCSRHFDTLEGDLAALANSTPELGLQPATFRKRTNSEPPEKPLQIRVRESERSRHQPTILEAISQSSVIKYMSVSSLDVVSADLYAQVSAGNGKKGQKAASDKSVDSGIWEDRASRKEDFGRKDQKPACSCRRALTFLVQCPKKMVFMLDFSLFKRPTFRLLMFYVTVSPFVNISLDYLPALAKENDVSETRASLLLSIIGGLDLFCRLSCGFIADLKILRVSTMIIISFVILALVTQFVRFMTSFEHFVVLAVLQGIFGGVANCLAPVLIIEFVGLQNMGKGIGFCQLISGASLCAVYPFLGYIRDTTGSYALVYHTIGCGLLIAAGLLCLEGPIKRLEARKDAKEHDNALPKIGDIEIVYDSSSNAR